MKIAILIISILITAFIISLVLFRRNYVNKIQQLEHNKLQIQNKPIFEEMTKIKQLNMTGETERKFEQWRADWTEVIDLHMPKIDNLFFEAEEQIDHIKFKKIKQTMTEIETEIQFCENKMNEILSDLDLLIGSEEKNRTEMESLQERHRAARKKVLAHQSSFGETVNSLEKKLELFNPKFEEYQELTESGNYLQAREIVISLTEQGDKLFLLIDQIPSLLKDLQYSIPNSIRELENGVREMEGQSFYLEHLEIDSTLKKLKEEIEQMVVRINKLEMNNVAARTEEIHEEIDGIYDALEKEVLAKHFVEAEYETELKDMKKVTKFIKQTLEEVSQIQESYRISEADAKIPEEALEKMGQLNKNFNLVTNHLEEENSAYSSLQETMNEIKKEKQKIHDEISSFASRIKNLRNDENKVREEVELLSKELQEVDRSLHKGNIPGIPSDINARLEEADEHLYIVRQSLEEVPLNMALVDSYLDNARKSIQDIQEKSMELLENVMLIEYIIQYGNRYRSSNEQIHLQLQEAEESFRQYRYAKALEEAATAVEAVEPGAIKRIEELLVERQ